MMKHYSRVNVALFSFLLLFSAAQLLAVEYRIPLMIESGFYEREDELVKTEIDFKRTVDTTSFIMIKGEKKENVPYYFIPGDRYKGKLYWILSGTLEPLTTVSFYLCFSEGNWVRKPSGSKEIADLVRQKGNLISNPGFEIEEEGEIKQTSTWEGEKKPLDWKLFDNAYAYRNLPDLKSRCRLSEEEAHEGKKSLKIASEVREDKNICGFARKPIFPLKPKTKYKFSFYLKITGREDTGNKYQAVTGQIQFLDENKKWIYPKNYALNRLQVGYSTARYPREAYLGKWIEAEGVKETPEEVRYGRIVISTWYFQGTVYYDDLVLSEVTEGEPVQVKVGEIEKIGGK